MKAEYTKAQDIISKAGNDLNRILNMMADNKTAEDREAFYTLETIINQIEEAAHYLNYLNSPTKAGTLEEDPSGKYYIIYDDGGKGDLLSCGHDLEIYYNDQWIIGRVEAREGDYIFYSDEIKPFLLKGMRARKRGRLND